MTPIRLDAKVPPFFVESCGYRGSARYVALLWMEELDTLWITDDGHARPGNASAMAFLWRRDKGAETLEQIRASTRERGRAPWLVVDRESGKMVMACAVETWMIVTGHEQRRRRW